MKLRIRTKLLLTYLLLIIIALSILALAVLGPLQNYYLQQVETELIKNARLISRIIEENLREENYAQLDKSIKDLGEQIDSRITVIKKTGEVIGETHKSILHMENHADRPEFQEALQGQIGTATRFSTTMDTTHLYAALPYIEQGKVEAVIRTSLPILGIEETYALLRETILLGGLFATLIALFLSVWLARTFTKPIEEISKTANNISKGDLEEKVFIASNDELALLGQSINEMTAALKNKINEVTTGKQRLEAILSHMASGVIVIDNTGIIQGVNPQAERIFGFKEKDVLGRPYHRVIRNFNILDNIDQVMHNQSHYHTSYEFSILHPEKHILKAYAAPVVYQNKIEQVVIVFHDITVLRHLEKMKTDFVANASHELRTPVASIKGFAETLLDGALEDREVAERFIRIINNEAERLTMLINDLLDLSRIESKSTAIEKSPTDIKQLLRESIEYLSSQAQEKGIAVSLEENEQLPPLWANQEMLRRAFLNLIDNGIKYTHQGGQIKIGAHKEKGHLLVRFSDSGVGIPKEDLPRIFERFFRVDKARSQDIKGTGLGLSIVKHIIEQHRGSIHVQSELGKGTNFTITLPL
ncbi:MAG: two-component system histidine kinase PnpS [Bacillota bacterium]